MRGNLAFLWRKVARRARVFAYLVPLSVIALALVSAIAVLGYFDRRLQDNRSWVGNVALEPSSRLLRLTFERALAAGWIIAQRTGNEARIEVASCENQLGPVPGDRAAEEATRRAHADRNAALSLLCSTQQGEALRAEIAAWNASFEVLAVRDDRHQEARCVEGATRQRLVYVHVGCKPSQWSVSRAAGDASVPLAISEVQQAIEPPAENFYMISRDRNDSPPTPHTGDWLVVPPYAARAIPGERFRLTSRIARPSSGAVRIDLIGQPVSIRVGGATHTFPQAGGASPETNWGAPIRLGPYQLEIDVICRDDCDRPPEEPVAYAYALRLVWAGGTRAPADVEIVAGRMRNVPRAIAIADEEQEEDDYGADERCTPQAQRERGERCYRMHRTLHLAATCPIAAPSSRDALTCHLAWQEPPTPGSGGGRGGGGEEQLPPVRVLASDGQTELISAETGTITDRALELGLAPIVGLGLLDSGSLAWSLTFGRTAEERQRTITIDVRLQEQAMQLLRERAACQRAQGRAGGICIRARQRASLIILDAEGERAGEIRAMASLPQPILGHHTWDIRALQIAEGSRTPWRVPDGHATPGSTYKVLTGVAAIEWGLGTRTAQGNQLLSILNGDASIEQAATFFGLRTWDSSRNGCFARDTPPGASSDMIPLTPQICPGNFGGGVFGSALIPTNISNCAGGAAAGRGGARIGLCEALLTSSNLFFAGAAVQMEQTPLPARDGASRFTLEMITRRLTPSGTPAREGRAASPLFDLTRGTLPRTPFKLGADPVFFEMTRSGLSPGDLREHIGRTGYGQRVQMSPLAVANVYASIGLGRVVRPRIVPRSRTSPDGFRDPEEGQEVVRTGAPGDRQRLLDVLRSGLAGVVRSARGTAASAFGGGRSGRRSHLAERTFGKTGTATVGTRRPTFSVWFGGWIDGQAGTQIPGRLAFVCSITHARNEDTGGGTCAPLVRAYLERLDRPPERAARVERRRRARQR